MVYRLLDLYGRMRVAVRDCDSVPGRVRKVRRGVLIEQKVEGRSDRARVLVAMAGRLCSGRGLN